MVRYFVGFYLVKFSGSGQTYVDVFLYCYFRVHTIIKLTIDL